MLDVNWISLNQLKKIPFLKQSIFAYDGNGNTAFMSESAFKNITVFFTFLKIIKSINK